MNQFGSDALFLQQLLNMGGLPNSELTVAGSDPKCSGH
jgi:hypothetical protein